MKPYLRLYFEICLVVSANNARGGAGSRKYLSAEPPQNRPVPKPWRQKRGSLTSFPKNLALIS